MSIENRFKISYKLILVIAVIIASVAALIFLPIKESTLHILEWIDNLGFWGPATLIFIYILATVLFLPGSILTLGAGFLFGLLNGTIYVIIASNVGAGLAFLIGRKFARGWVEKKVEANDKFKAIDDAVANQALKIVLLTRLSPLIPFNLLNYAFGLTKVTFQKYITGTIAGMLPGTIMYVYLGSATRSLADLLTGQSDSNQAQNILFWGGLLATIILTYLITKASKEEFDKAIAKNNGGK